MTKGKSLVEDMARAIDPEAWTEIDELHANQAVVPNVLCDRIAASLTAATAALAVLKDRLPADDRELVERLRSSAKAFRENSVFTSDGDEVRLGVQADECDQAADRIIAYSALTQP